MKALLLNRGRRVISVTILSTGFKGVETKISYLGREVIHFFKSFTQLKKLLVEHFSSDLYDFAISPSALGLQFKEFFEKDRSKLPFFGTMHKTFVTLESGQIIEETSIFKKFPRPSIKKKEKKYEHRISIKVRIVRRSLELEQPYALAAMQGGCESLKTRFKTSDELCSYLYSLHKKGYKVVIHQDATGLFFTNAMKNGLVKISEVETPEFSFFSA